MVVDFSDAGIFRDQFERIFKQVSSELKVKTIYVGTEKNNGANLNTINKVIENVNSNRIRFCN